MRQRREKASEMASDGIALLDFLTLVTPGAGDKVCAVIEKKVVSGKGSPVRHHLCTTHVELASHISGRGGDGDVYFAPGGYKSGSVDSNRGRRQENVLSLRAFWLDIDVGDSVKNKYGSRREAGQALSGFCDALNFPEPLLVTSGSGLHVYWPLDADISRSDWKRIATLLKQACNQYQLKVDHSRTTDEASILRPVGTLNHKTAPPKAVKAIPWERVPASAAAIEEKLNLFLSGATASPKIDFTGVPALGNSSALLAKLGGALGDDREYVSLPALRRMSPHVTLKSATAYFESKGEHKEERNCWLDAVLLPLKSEALNRLAEASELKNVYLKVNESFGGHYDVVGNEKQWEGTSNIGRTTIATFIAIAKHGGYVDTDSEAAISEALVERFNASYAFVDMNGKASIIGEQFDPGFGFKRLTFSRPQQFRELYPEPFTYRNAAGKQRTTTRANYWLASERKRRYANIAFLPGTVADENIYNLWQGFATNAVKGDCLLLLGHIRKNICSGDESSYKKLMQFLAHAVQRPSEKPGFMVVLIGAEGVGKGVFVHAVGELFGRHYCSQLDVKALTSQFNGELAEAIFCFADEVSLTGKSDGAERFKRIITEPSVRLERKGIDAIEVKSYHRFILATNNAHAVPAGANARRFFVLKVASAAQQNHAYFAAIKHQQGNGGREALLYHLSYEVDLSDFDPQKAPATSALKEQKRLSLPPLEGWFCAHLESGEWWLDPDAPIEVQPSKIVDDFRIATSEKVTAEHVGRTLKKLFPTLNRIQKTVSGNRRMWVTVLPELSIAREQFQSATGVQLAPDEST
jgi:Family of unknown function (DUF5906)